MTDSRFRKNAEADIKVHGYGTLLDPDYSALIKKTVINKYTAARAAYTWLDSQGRIIACCENGRPDDPDMPLIGKIEIEDSRAEYLKQYDKTRKRYDMRLTHRDQDIIDWLDAQPNVQGYLKMLIRKDINQHTSNSETRSEENND